MRLKLKPGHSGFAPSGIPFTDQRTGAKFDGYERSIEGAITMLIAHRRNNPKIYPSSEPQWFDEPLVRQEFFRHLQTHRPDMFLTIEGEVGQPIAPTTERCYHCGSTEFEEVLCPTCSGRKVIGKKCKACGAKLY